jgi:hypothetical protein
MAMDPSMMMGNNNFGGMGGMNDMNMMASMMGAGGFGAGMPGMGMNQGFGMNGGGGYNRVGNHYNQQQPFHPNARGFNRPYGRGFRGRGAGGYGFGRGGRGGGGFNQFGPGAGFNQGFQNGMHNGMHQQQQQNGFHGQHEDQQQISGDTGEAEPGAGRASPTYEAMKTENGPTLKATRQDQMGKTLLMKQAAKVLTQVKARTARPLMAKESKITVLLAVIHQVSLPDTCGANAGRHVYPLMRVNVLIRVKTATQMQPRWTKGISTALLISTAIRISNSATTSTTTPAAFTVRAASVAI